MAESDGTTAGLRSSVVTPPVLPGRFASVIFDLDGLLVDSEPLWLRAEAGLLDAHGGSMTPEDEAATHGRSIDASVRVYAERLGMTNEVAQLRLELVDRARALYRSEAQAMPGAEDVVQRLHGRIPMAVASNSDRDLVELALTRVGLAGRFDTVVTARDVAQPKPWPDVYLEACRKLRVRPQDSIGFEDSPPGIEALRSAGLTSVGVRSTGGPGLERADHVVDSLVAIVSWIEAGW